MFALFGPFWLFRIWFSFQDEDLGTIALGILYLSFTIFSLIASLVVRMMGSKNALILGTTGYWLFMAANLKPRWYYFLSIDRIRLSSWVCVYIFLSLIAEERNRTKNFQSHVSCSFDFYKVKILPQVNQEYFGPKYCKIPYFLIDQTEPFDFFTPLFTCNLCFLS